MGSQARGEYESESVIPFAPTAKSAAPANVDLDKAGQTILGLLHKAAGVAEANSQHALGMAHISEAFSSASGGRRSDRRARG